MGEAGPGWAEEAQGAGQQLSQRGTLNFLRLIKARGGAEGRHVHHSSIHSGWGCKMLQPLTIGTVWQVL